MSVEQAQDALEAAVLRTLQARHYYEDTNPHASAAQELADEQVRLAARDLVRAVEAQPAGDRPVFWDSEQVPA
ncbi:MAG TPA: hypothetical protein VI172_19955 [Candidatus Dormibacteraeota bacterium]|jgi:hypothetical protein